MIPPVDKQGLVDALDRFNREFRDTTEYTGWEENRAHKYAIQEHGRLYPVKQIIHLATGASKRDFNGGAESNGYVEERGLTVVPLRSEIENKFQSSLEAILGSYAELRRSEPFGQNSNLWRAFGTIKTHLEQLPSRSSYPRSRGRPQVGGRSCRIGAVFPFIIRSGAQNT